LCKLDKKGAVDVILVVMKTAPLLLIIKYGDDKMSESEQSLQIDFDKVIENGLCLVDFNAPWCGPCRSQEPVINELEQSYKGKANVVKINIDENSNVAMKLGIQSIPTIILFKNGKEVSRFVGVQTSATLNRAIKDNLNE
jgi:thioredoxin 1